MRRSILVAVAMLMAVVLTRPNGTEPAPAPVAEPPAGIPSAFVVLGDSMSTAAGTCLRIWQCPANNWATGTNPAVNSQYWRLRTAFPEADVRAFNFARPAVGVEDLAYQAESAVLVKAEYVTILIGANDACAWPMTGVRDFRRSVTRALRILKKGRPDARIQVLSLPDLYRLWKIGHGYLLAVAAWQFQECPSLMANSRSTAPADVSRRKQVADRIDAYNKVLRTACKKHRNCRWDGGRVHRAQFTLDMVGVDFFHPNLLGQQKIAEVSSPDWSAWAKRPL